MNSKPFKDLLIACSTGLALRLAFLPFAKNVEPDSISRTFAAWRWLARPELISHGVWGPLHTYVIAAALAVWPNAVVAPALLNTLFAVATAIPLYFLTRERFSENGALFVALAYMCYPVAVRNSLMAVSEIPFGFFAACAWLYVSRASRNGGTSLQALFAGLLLTLAAALRYEAWVLIPLFALFLVRRPSVLFVFLVASLSFPVFWMIGNFIHHGDPLLGVNAATHWQVQIEGINEGLSFRRMVARLGFYPWNLFFGLTPVVCVMAIVGVLLCATRSGGNRKLLAWLMPFLGLGIVFLVKAVGGSLLLRGRYSIILGILLLPFSSLTFERLRRKKLFMILIVATMIPLSLIFSRLPYLEETAAVPTLDTAQADRVAKAIKENDDAAAGGLILDSLDWTHTYYLALMTGRHPSGIFIAPGGKHQDLDLQAFRGFLESYGRGTLVLRDGSRFAQEFVAKNGGTEFSSTSQLLSLEEVDRIDDIAVFRYQLSDKVPVGQP